MALTRPHRPPFDARHEFVATPTAGRPTLRVSGAEIASGQRLDKSLIDARRLRQMYDGRLIAIAPGSPLPAKRAPRPGAVGPVDMTLPPAAPAARPTSQPRAVPRRPSRRAA